MANAILFGLVSVRDERLRREESLACVTLDAFRLRGDVQRWIQRARALAEAFVLNFDRVQAFVRVAGRRVDVVQLAFVVQLQEAGAEPFGIGLRDESARWGIERQNLCLLQNVQLIVGATRAVNVQTFARGVDFLQGEILQDRVQDFRQAESFLSADDEAGDSLA